MKEESVMRIFKNFYFMLVLLFFPLAKSVTLLKSDIERIQKQVGFIKYYKNPSPQKKLKIAVFDKGFLGFEQEIGKTLPQQTYFHQGPVEQPPMDTTHGTVMAQVLITLLTDHLKIVSLIPELHLYDVRGFSNFKEAVKSSIENKIDLILYSEILEYGGNFDGSGFFNQVVNSAINSKIIWVNAAGNFRNSTYNSFIKNASDEWVHLPCQGERLEIRCHLRNDEHCSLRVVLSWNDFKDDPNVGTPFDLDLLLLDDMFNYVASSQLIQSVDGNENLPNHSKYPREIIESQIGRGIYFLKIKNRSKNFDRSHQLRLSISGSGIELPPFCKSSSIKNRTDDETVHIPADNPQIITVGAFDSPDSSYSIRLQKPEFLTISSITVDNHLITGSSIAAAVVAAGVSLVKAYNPKIDSDNLRSLVSKSRYDFQRLGFDFTRPGCFEPLPNFFRWPPHVQNLIERGGVCVQTTRGAKILVNFDPIVLTQNLNRHDPLDVIAAVPIGFYLFPRILDLQNRLPPGAIEIFEGSYSLICQNSQVPWDRRARVGDIFEL